MSDNSKIEWTDATWNPIVGCSHASPGCDHCYAERIAYRLACMGQEKYQNVVFGKGYIEETMQGHWNGYTILDKTALMIPLKYKMSKVIFVCSMGDLFHEFVPFEWIDKVFAVMALCPQHVFICLTKRAGRMNEYVCNTETHRNDARGEALHSIDKNAFTDGIQWPLPNVILGVTAENQAAADERIPLLLQTPAARRMVSIEPMLGAVDWIASMPTPQNRCGSDEHIATGKWFTHGLDWVILGGESGPGARPMHPDWVRSVRDQCDEAGVPFFFKQWGEWAIHKDVFHQMPEGHLYKAWPNVGKETGLMSRVGKKLAGRMLDGVEHNGVPEMVQKIRAARDAVFLVLAVHGLYSWKNKEATKGTKCTKV